jgi:acyl-CoA synthetase (AMP-forming)/AMP-acid ligase II
MLFKSPYPDVAIPDIDLTTFFLSRIRDFGNKTAVINGITHHSYTYDQLAAAIKKAAFGLHKRGLKKGDVFAIYSPNLPEYIIAFHAISLVGGTITTINPLYTPEEIHHQLRDSNAIFILTISQFLENAQAAILDTGVKEIFTFDSAKDSTPFADLLREDGELPEIHINPAEDILALPYSSGTTGFPKGVMLTHRNIIANIVQCEGLSNYRLVHVEDRVIGILPFFHIYGMVVVMNMTLVSGATIVTMPRFDLVQFLELIQKYRITKTNLVPPVLVALAKHPLVDNYDLSSIIEFFSGAAPLSQELAAEVSKRIHGCSVVQGYGLTETSPVTHVYNRSMSKTEKLGSVGPAVPNTENMIVDVDSGQPLGVNQKGEVWTRGPQVMKGYLNNPKATKITIDENGWLHTGDIGYVDEEGNFYIVDRLKELIKYKGYQVAPAELEALLLSHPAVADAAVIPVADEEAGEIPKAFVVKKQGASLSEDELMAWVSEHVSPQKKIRKVEFTDIIPKSLSGKILRRVLVEKERSKTA